MNERVLWDGLPTILMVLVQFGFAGVNICYKLAAADGMSLKIIIAYRFLFASAFILPIAFFLERGRRPKLTWSVLFYAFLCGLFGGSLSQNLYVESLALTSATFASAIGNLVPGITFILAVSFRFKFITYMLERMNIRTMGGKAKVVGTLIGLGGAMVLTLYKGVELHLWSTRVDLLNKSHNSSGHVAAPEHDIHSQVLGSVLGVGSCFSYALWLIVQAKMSECYPCHYSSTALMCMMGSLQAVGFALCVETQWTRWKLGWNIRLLSVAYTGIVASGVMVTLITWCVRMRGPMFVSVFSPLILFLVAIAASLFLQEKLYLGCVIGGMLIVCGLYIVLWGKSKEMRKITQLAPMESIEEQQVGGGIDLVISTATPLPKTHVTNNNNAPHSNN
ncbi:WAT1-related protein At1g25270-like isoform X1 [Benincasa hispida]|uniref:WAT1-related protein At1g25270-like isoform X1 n=1 Tax=Benincasa hispida TaxID=102211 RepID=UPI0019011B10|nr:WAT1-related protein At1g25270-like isoform X1 [Benincasa hispida]